MALGSKERTLDELPISKVVWKIAASFILMMPGLVLSDRGAFLQKYCVDCYGGKKAKLTDC